MSYPTDQLSCSTTASHFANNPSEEHDVDPKWLRGFIPHIVCQLCGYSFAGKTKYGRHMAEHHPRHPVNFTYVCPVCSKGFFSSRGLSHHMEIHSERPSCHLCPSTFSYTRNLKRHIESVHNLKDCRYCKQFINTAGFHSHLRECMFNNY